MAYWKVTMEAKRIATDAIIASILRGETVEIRAGLEAHELLLSKCDGLSAHRGVQEYWGRTTSGDWRVKVASERPSLTGA